MIRATLYIWVHCECAYTHEIFIQKGREFSQHFPECMYTPQKGRGKKLYILTLERVIYLKSLGKYWRDLICELSCHLEKSVRFTTKTLILLTCLSQNVHGEHWKKDVSSTIHFPIRDVFSQQVFLYRDDTFPEDSYNSIVQEMCFYAMIYLQLNIL